MPTFIHMSNRPKWFLKEWRKFRGLSQDKLAERLGVHKGDISNWEKGKRRYNQDLLEQLADALQCEPADLIMRDPTQPEAIWSIWDHASEGQKEEIRRFAEFTVKEKKAG
jgi:transcriptional regulator with XRE-family HTH domain